MGSFSLVACVSILACLGQLADSNPHNHQWRSYSSRSGPNNGISHGGSSYHSLGIQASASAQTGRENNNQYWWQGNQSPFNQNAGKNQGVVSGAKIDTSRAHARPLNPAGCAGGSCLGSVVGNSISASASALSGSVDNSLSLSYLPPPQQQPARPSSHQVAASSHQQSSLSRPSNPPFQSQNTVTTPYQGPLADVQPHPGCASAMKCVTEEYCSLDGVMVNTPVRLTAHEKEYLRVPMMPCLNTETQQVGFCCRDPLYNDPWPAGMPMPGMTKVPVQPAVPAPANVRPIAPTGNNIRPVAPSGNNIRPVSVSAATFVSTSNVVNPGTPSLNAGASFHQPTQVQQSATYFPPAPAPSSFSIPPATSYLPPPQQTVLSYPSAPAQQPAPSVAVHKPTYQPAPAHQPVLVQQSISTYQPATPSHKPAPSHQSAFVYKPAQSYQPVQNTVTYQPAPVHQQAASTFQQTSSVYRPTPSQNSFPQGPAANVQPFPGCAAALKCVTEEFCSLDGMMVNTPVTLSAFEKEYLRVPLMSCLNTETNKVGYCCRDPLYNDPWPAGMPMP